MIILLRPEYVQLIITMIKKFYPHKPYMAEYIYIYIKETSSDVIKASVDSMGFYTRFSLE